MCGIIGGISTKKFDESAIKCLFLLAMSRGRDSCGIANGVSKEIIKQVGDAREFVQEDLSGLNRWIGHTRAKTTGCVINRNAHPFQYGKIIGVHNGYINNWWQLQNEEDIDIQVDSEIIFYLLNKYGLEETLSRIKGTLAIAWFEDTKLHLYRKDNPIYLAKYNGGWLFGSSSIYFKALGISSDNIYNTKEHTLYTFKKKDLIQQTELPESIKPQNSWGYGNWNNNWGGNYNNGHSQTNQRTIGYNTESNKSNIKKLDNSKPSVVTETEEFSGTVPSHAGKVIEDGIIYHYWFSTTEQFILNVAVYFNYNGKKDYLFENKRFNITKNQELQNLKALYPEVFEKTAQTIDLINIEHDE